MRKSIALIIASLTQISFGAPTYIENPLSCKNVDVPSDRELREIVIGQDNWLYHRSTFNDMPTFSGDAWNGLDHFVHILSKKDIKLFIVPIPSKPSAIPSPIKYDPSNELENYIVFLSHLSKYNVGFVDLMSLSSKNDQLLSQENYYSHSDTHWTAHGARISAELVAREMLRSSQYDKIFQNLNFTTVKSSSRLDTGNLSSIINKKCEEKWESERFEEYATTESGIAGSELLSDLESPITLIGTSFSDNRRFNFAGFLSEFLRTRVLPANKSGGSIFGAMHDFLVDPNTNLPETKIIIWEFPVYYSTKTSSEFAQLSGDLLGKCRNNLYDSSIKPNKATVISPTTGNFNYFTIVFSDPLFNRFNLSIKYKDETTEDLVIDRANSTLKTSDTQFNFYPTKSINRNIDSLSIIPSGHWNKEINAAVYFCKEN
ncbi:hypothetical protein GCM10008961_16930 [Deinococcus knuensis]|uniref:AlgX/AlgJ SGNH hydrolase-like domain-containing protein n=2 Tax=Deinococcus knuensis TaxID=1837380 RepID=A0ABQ2SFI6_9DEIO|nr:hypothetical protein GCM10008961_16930 [Deinococcus knuensis]